MARKLLPTDEVWLRQPGETEKAYAAFQIYLEMGEERTVTKCSQNVGKSRKQIDRWRGKFNWKERAQEYDNFIAYGKAIKTQREIEVQFDRFGRMGDQLTALGLTKAKGVDPAKLSHREAIEYIQLGLKLAEARRAALTIPEVQARRLDLAYLKLEATQADPPSEQGGSNLIEALSATLTETRNVTELPNAKESEDEPVNKDDSEADN